MPLEPEIGNHGTESFLGTFRKVHELASWSKQIYICIWQYNLKQIYASVFVNKVNVGTDSNFYSTLINIMSLF